MAMSKEIEAKWLKVNKNEIRNKLKEIGAVMISPEKKFTRIVFEIPTNANKNTWVRLRDEGNKTKLALKSFNKDLGINGMQEVEFEVEDFEKARLFLNQIGLVERNFQENYRESWTLGEVSIEIDTWPMIDPYLEVEAVNEAEVKRVFELLGLDYSKAYFGPTGSLFEDIYKLNIDDYPRLVFNQ